MINGYHTFYKFENDFWKNNPEEWDAIDVLAQLTSILFWKKNYGPIKLYANTDHLNHIKKYGIEQEYDFIDTDLLDSIPHKDKASRYWSFSKIHAAKEIAKHDTEFCIIDTDLWLKEPGLLKTDCDFTAFHEEWFDINKGFNNYHDAINWMDQHEVDKFDWSCWPINCAIMHFKNRTQELINTWYDEVTKVILLDKNPDCQKNISNSAIFVEQRMLPTIANKLGVSYNTIKPNSFLVRSFKDKVGWNNSWVPPLYSSEESIRIEKSIAHVWGKRIKYRHDGFRRRIIHSIIMDITTTFPGIHTKYETLFKECHDLLNIPSVSVRSDES
jgi:hypothetical protein